MKKLIFLTIAILFLSASLFSASALAQSEVLQPGTNEAGDVTTPLANPNDAYGLLGNLVSTVINIIIFGGAVTAFIFFIIGAIQWGTAGGGDGAAKGRLTMIYAAVGLLLLGFVYVVILIYNQLVA